MELRHLRYFVAVAEDLNFSRAAERLHIAQPPLSQQIRALERELDVELFLRSKRRVELTDAGRVFLSEARRTLAQADHAVEAARRARRGELGQLRVGFMDSAAYHYLPLLLRGYRQRFPEVEVSLQPLPSGHQVQAILEDRIQVGLLRLDEIGRSALAYQLVGHESLVVAMPSNHSLAPSPSISVEEVAEEPFISFRRPLAPAVYDELAGLFRESGLTLRIVWEANEYGTIIALVAAGMGLALVPETVRHFASHDVVYRPLKNAASLQTALAWRRGDRSELVKALAKTAAELFPDALPPPD